MVFLALPHGQSGALAAALLGDDRSWSTAAPTSGCATRPSGSSSTAATHAGTWPYGLPELPGQRDALARRPPDRRTRLLPDGRPPSPSRPRWPPAWSTPDVVVVAASGTSGAGKAAKPHLLGSEVMGNASAYGVGGVHRHTPEIVQNLAGPDRGRGRG